MKKILILGAMGFIGKNIIHALRQKYDLIAYDREGAFAPLLYNDILCYEGDFKTETRWTQILNDVDCVIHLISTTNVNSKTGQIETEIQENVLPTVRLLEAMVLKKVNRMIFISSGGTVYGMADTYPIKEHAPLQPICPYGVHKKMIESYLTLYNYLYKMDNIILRVANPYGLGQNVLRTQGIIPIFINHTINKLPITIWGNGENIRDYIYMEDLMSAISIILDYQGEYSIFNVGTGVGYSIKDILRLIQKELNVSDVDVQYLPGRTVDVPINILDNRLLIEETGWQPNTTLPEGIKFLCQQLQQRSYPS